MGLSDADKQKMADAALYALTVEKDTAKAKRIADLADAVDSASADGKDEK